MDKQIACLISLFVWEFDAPTLTLFPTHTHCGLLLLEKAYKGLNYKQMLYYHGFTGHLRI